MENTQNNMPVYSSGSNKKTFLIIVSAIVVLGVLMWWLKQGPSKQAQVSPTPDAESAAINDEVNTIDTGDLNAEFKGIDTDIQGF